MSQALKHSPSLVDAAAEDAAPTLPSASPFAAVSSAPPLAQATSLARSLLAQPELPMPTSLDLATSLSAPNPTTSRHICTCFHAFGSYSNAVAAILCAVAEIESGRMDALLCPGPSACMDDLLSMDGSEATRHDSGLEPLMSDLSSAAPPPSLLPHTQALAPQRPSDAPSAKSSGDHSCTAGGAASPRPAHSFNSISAPESDGQPRQERRLGHEQHCPCPGCQELPAAP